MSINTNITYAVLDGFALPMSSRDIAELCDKQHKHVLVECQKSAAFYVESYSAEKSAQWVKPSTYTDSTGRTLPCFDLNKQASLDLVTGYSLPHRHAVNKRWQELETQVAKQTLPDFTNPVAVARACGDDVETYFFPGRRRFTKQIDQSIASAVQQTYSDYPANRATSVGYLPKRTTIVTENRVISTSGGSTLAHSDSRLLCSFDPNAGEEQGSDSVGCKRQSSRKTHQEFGINR